MNYKKAAIALAVSSISASAFALSPSVGDPGFSGSINLGGGGGKAETNFVSEMFGIDISDDQLEGINAEDKSLGLPAFGYDLGWTFSGGNTRVFIADDAHGDILEFDGRTALGIRYDSNGIGNFQLEGLVSSGETNVYRDPYQSGKRDDTEYTNNGGRFTWDQMFGSQLELMLEATKVEVDKERSGSTTLGLSQADRKLLERDGDVMKASLGYLFDLGGGHSLRPAIGYVDYDLDGDAMSRKGGEVEMAYGYQSSGFELSLAGRFAKLDGDKVNPIFLDENDMDSWSVSGGMSFPGAFGWQNWVPGVSAIFAKDDSDIDFNTAQVWIGSVTIGRAF